MAKNMAVVNQSGVVVNLIVGDETSPTEAGTYLVEIPANVFCNIGFTWDGTNFLNQFGVPVFYEEEPE